ncbi:HAMP domain-containing histidine kinase [Leucothrix sargassi]|nr:HAMP domain-containing histidine kinase [Leucothrix sargassi]
MASPYKLTMTKLQNTRRSIANEMRWGMGLITLLMVLVYSYFLLSYFDRGLEEAMSSNLRLEARAYAAHYENNDDVVLPTQGKMRLYADWSALPESFRKRFKEDTLVHNRLAVVDNIKPRWPLISRERPDDGQLFAIFYFKVNDEKQIYATYNLTKEDFSQRDIETFESNLKETLPLGVISLLLMLGLTYLLSRRISQSIQRLEVWTHQLSVENCKNPPPDFNYREANELAQRLQEAFVRISQLVEREHYFLRHASHELRTPIAVTKTSLELLNKIGLRDNQVSPFKRLQRANKNMQQLTETLLWSSRETTPNLHHTDVDVRALLQEQVDDLQYLLEGKDVELSVKPESLELAIQSLPETPLRIVFSNLIRNAFQHTPSGEVRIHLEKNILRIQNTYHEKSSEPQTEHSFGLGLMLVHELCDRLDWKVDLNVESSWMQVEVQW